ncbi:hypothetical protein Kuja_1220 [Vibrio phage vB_VchM_Kuja]|uniref:Uncharacterized protein n=1 Tax=Vibrio phage vB_VchM_Kuja TaxID=2686437 RepID=A0A6B9J977_9CAUD|nr:hypothetical protein HWC83_gp114 [Vibrio phage vB_VchM_Kuja]QGZ16113.1 hypothetical protein Kuja_1220 [Vibrio phage vB_VchM_Kuja]
MTKRIMVTKFKYVAKAVEKYRTSRNFHISAAGKRVGQIVYHVGSNKYHASVRVITRNSSGGIGWDWVTFKFMALTPEEVMVWLDSKAVEICDKFELTNGTYKNEKLNFLARSQRRGQNNPR